MADRMIESTRPGFHWAINCFKPHGTKGVVVVSGQEGKLKNENGYQSFEYVIFESRLVRDQIPVKRLTAKKKKELLDDLESRMRDAGVIA